MSDVNLTKAALERATATFTAIQAPRLYGRHHHLFGARRWWILRRDYEDLWAYADTWSALCTLGSLPRQKDPLDLLHAMVGGLRSYSRVPEVLESTGDAGFESVVTAPLGGGGDRYYDDNAWLGLALVRHHELTGNAELLRLAQRVFSFVVSGWSTEETWQIPGGIRWKEPTGNHSRNTCVNGPASELAARLYEKTGNTSYLSWATRIYDWTRRALLGPESLYMDQIAADGTQTPAIWSYNQGSMIGAGVLLARQTGEKVFLDQAAETAAAYIATQGVPELTTQDPAFNAVLFRNLLMLDQERPDHRYRSITAQYASNMWASKRSQHGLFEGNGSRLHNAAAMVQIYALLAGAQPHP
jgi:hypothetical protein